MNRPRNIRFSLAPLGVVSAAQGPGSIYLANEARADNTFLSQPLTEYALGWYQSEQPLRELLEFLAPEVSTARRFEYRAANTRDAFLMAERDEDVRALHGEFKQITSTGEIVQEKTHHKGFSILIDKDEIKDNPMAEEQGVAILTKLLLRAEIYRAHTMLSGIAVNSNKTWSTAADADMDIIAALTAGGDAAGLDPNRALFGAAAWQRRLLGLRALDTAGGFANASLTIGALADWLQIDGAMVSKERYQAKQGKETIVTSNVVLLFNAQSGAAKDDPSNIKRFISNAEGGRFAVYRHETATSVEITVSHYSNIVITSNSGIRKLTIS